jgi:hypothetical protein
MVMSSGAGGVVNFEQATDAKAKDGRRTVKNARFMGGGTSSTPEKPESNLVETPRNAQ